MKASMLAVDSADFIVSCCGEPCCWNVEGFNLEDGEEGVDVMPAEGSLDVPC